MLSIYATISAFFYTAKGRFASEKGATAVEYGLLVGLIAVVIIAAVTLLGGNLNTLFNNVSTSIPTTKP